MKAFTNNHFSCLSLIPFYTAQASLIIPESATVSGMFFVVGFVNGFIDGKTSSQNISKTRIFYLD